MVNLLLPILAGVAMVVVLIVLTDGIYQPVDDDFLIYVGAKQ